MHCTIHVNGQRRLLDDVIFALLCGSREYPLAGCRCYKWFGIPYITTDLQRVLFLHRF